MSGALPACPVFADFYEALHERVPFPWQERLADQVASSGRWPREIGIPTGLGKTSCLDIAVWWLASQAEVAPENRIAPTRIWWLVNRRLLVDSTARHAHRLAELLEQREQYGDDAIAAVARRLASLASSPGSRPLEVIRLRGGVAASRPTDPAQPAVILSTIPMYGSRLLFRGYGVSRSMRPIEAALAGSDALVLVDEAHLARHLVNLFPALRACNPNSRSPIPAQRHDPVVVSLTATGETLGDRFDLDTADEANPVVAQRLDAAKPVEVVAIEKARKGDPAQAVVEETARVVGEAAEPVAALVFVNTPAVAREVATRLEKEMAATAEAEIVLSTGRSRERESERVRARILDPISGMPADRPPGPRPHHLVVVATQTLEVGADIDAEVLVTEACGVRALTQRLGRLNRLGRHHNARGVYVHVEPPRKDHKSSPSWPVYGTEPAQVLRQLEAAMDENRTVDLSPRRVSVVLGEPSDDPGRAPEVLPALLWEWVKTTTPPDGEAPVEPYFSGIAHPDRTVSVVWRAHVPGDGEKIWPRVRDREVVDVPIGELREALGNVESVVRLGVDGVKVETCSPDRLRPGDVVIVPCDQGMLDEFGWSPAAAEPVLDVSLLEVGLPLDAVAIRRFCGATVDAALISRALGGSSDEEVGPDEQAEAVAEVLSALGGDPVVVPGEGPRLRWADRETPVLVDELDELSLTTTAVELDRHGEGVGARARAVAESVGIDPRLAEIIELAGRFHDLGKADPRFQRWLDPSGTAGTLLAKSTTPRHRWERSRVAAGWPEGGRHEDLSARLVSRWLAEDGADLTAEEADLLEHLVISHHGRGRPLVPPADDITGGRVRAPIGGREIEVDADLSVVDWEQAARFRRLNDFYGPWGLALLEAIVRRADHAVSAGGWAGAEVR